LKRPPSPPRASGYSCKKLTETASPTPLLFWQPLGFPAEAKGPLLPLTWTLVAGSPPSLIFCFPFRKADFLPPARRNFSPTKTSFFLASPAIPLRYESRYLSRRRDSRTFPLQSRPPRRPSPPFPRPVSRNLPSKGKRPPQGMRSRLFLFSKSELATSSWPAALPPWVTTERSLETA